MYFNIQKLITFTESILTYRKKNQFIKKEKQKKLHPFLDWIGAFLWAACFVLILNQYLFQNYVIPSKSMESTLLVGDRVLVNKFIYGPEILPGIGKMHGYRNPDREDVIVLENPEYISRGTFFDLTSRLIFMLTLSTVDLDKDVDGNPAHHFLIKRGIATNGDTVQFRNGEVFIKPNGEGSFLSEEVFKKTSGEDYNTQRLLNIESYTIADNEIRESVYQNQNSHSSIYYKDLYYSRQTNYKYLSHISPSMLNYYQEFNKKRIGIYIPSNWILPLGDNRDNSKDGRYFGIVHSSEILGKASFKFWPFSRIGSIK